MNDGKILSLLEIMISRQSRMEERLDSMQGDLAEAKSIVMYIENDHG